MSLQSHNHSKNERVSGNPDFMVENFFQVFSQALTNGDIEAIKNHWGIPSLVMSNQIQMAVKSESEIERFFKGTKEQYKLRGISEAVPEIENIQWLTDRISLVGVRWPYYDMRGREVGEESSCYTLKLDDNNRLRIFCVVMQGEKNQSEHSH